MKPETKSALSGIGIFVGLTFVFLILRLAGVTHWPWWAIISPVLVYLFMVFVAVVMAVGLYIRDKNKNQ